MINRSRFAELANAFGTDKVAVHGYHRFYPLVLSQLHGSEPFTIVEIGYGNGSSIPLWKQLFPHAFLICIDRDVSEEGDGYMVLQADQDEPEQLQAGLRNLPSPVRLVIDDGSHLPRHQLSSFSLLFETTLEPGGFYIIEDIETSYGHLEKSEQILICRRSRLTSGKYDSVKPWGKEASGTNRIESPSFSRKNRYSCGYLNQSRGRHFDHYWRKATRKSGRATRGESGLIR